MIARTPSNPTPRSDHPLVLAEAATALADAGVEGPEGDAPGARP
jgi:hypothetical protein